MTTVLKFYFGYTFLPHYICISQLYPFIYETIFIFQFPET